MTSDEARARFDAALDGELSEAEQAAFDRAVAADPALAAELARHRDVLDRARTLGREEQAVDLLEGVQDKLRARSGGRFYRDRFASQRSTMASWLMIGASALLVLFVLGWLALEAGAFAR